MASVLEQAVEEARREFESDAVIDPEDEPLFIGHPVVGEAVAVALAYHTTAITDDSLPDETRQQAAVNVLQYGIDGRIWPVVPV